MTGKIVTLTDCMMIGMEMTSKIDYTFSVCASHPDPDLWFPEFSQGAITDRKAKAMAEQVKCAIELCDQCPLMVECLTEGMKDENITYGIWGGLLAGQRLELLGRVRSDYALQSEKGKAMDFHERIKPWLG
jgi:hypothetical protein